MLICKDCRCYHPVSVSDRFCGECCIGDTRNPIAINADITGCCLYESKQAIEAEPVRNGRWIEKPPYADETVKGLEFQIVCSRCDEQNASINFNDDGEIIGKTFYKTKFCPNCGAKMDLRTPTEAQLD